MARQGPPPRGNPRRPPKAEAAALGRPAPNPVQPGGVEQILTNHLRPRPAGDLLDQLGQHHVVEVAVAEVPQHTGPRAGRIYLAKHLVRGPTTVQIGGKGCRVIAIDRESAAPAEDLADRGPSGVERHRHSLRLAYPLLDGGTVDALGDPLEDERPPSALVRGERTVAVLTHRPGLLDDPTTAEEVARAATLVLDNERLQAELAAQLDRLRASRQRLVKAGDAERRRLERDLHDGAQQRLVTLLLHLRLLRNSRGADEDQNWVAHKRRVEQELECAIADLHELAQGIFPAVLADEGLTPAVDAFAEGARIPVDVRAPDEHVNGDGAIDPTMEGVAYFVVAESIERSNARQAAVSITRASGRLCVVVDLEGVPRLEGGGWVIGVEDRVGAVNGRLDISGAGTRMTLRAEIPCGS